MDTKQHLSSNALGSYGCSKSALLTLTKICANELRPHRIRVNTVNPGVPACSFARLPLSRRPYACSPAAAAAAAAHCAIYNRTFIFSIQKTPGRGAEGRLVVRVPNRLTCLPYDIKRDSSSFLSLLQGISLPSLVTLRGVNRFSGSSPGGAARRA